MMEGSKSKTAMETQEKLNTRHVEKMRRKKEFRDKMEASKTKEKGLLIVHTGKGKGKSTAAFGLVFRALGHGFKIGVVQFIKGAWSTGEREVLENYSDQVTIKAMGEGFTWQTQDRQRDIAATTQAWEEAKRMIRDTDLQMVLLDELNVVLRYGYLDLDEVIKVLKNKPEMKHVIVTGRNAKNEIIEIADLVTEMVQIKHPYRDQGVRAQAGIEF